MAGAEVLAGAEGLDREVTGASIIEVPDVYRWLRGGEILFTAGYAWRDRPEGLVEVMAELERIGVSAVGIKTGKYLKEIPPRLLEISDEFKLPLIRIPPTLAYREVIDPLYRRITTQRLSLFERSTQAHEVMFSLGLDDQSIEKVASALASEVRDPVYVVDFVDNEIVSATPVGPATRRPIEELEGRDAAVVSRVTELTLKRTPTRIEVDQGPALGASLVVGRRSHGRIVVLERDGPLDEFVELALTHAAELISFLLMRQIAILEGRREASELFFESLLSDDLTNEEAAERALTLGLRLTHPCVALVVGAQRLPSDDAEMLRVAAERALSSYAHALGHGEDDTDLLILLQPPKSGERSVLDKIMQRLQKAASRAASIDLLVACGSPRTGLQGVRQSRSEAMIAYKVARRRCQTGLICFADLGVERLLAQIPATSRLTRGYVKSLVGPLEEDSELMRTLEAYLEHGGNKVATAGAIPLHRSSLVYRLEKIAKLLGANLDDPEERLELWLALRLRRILRLSGTSGSD